MSSDVQDWTVLSMLEWATDFFQSKGIPDPRLSIEWLLADVLEIKRLDLYLSFERPLGSDELNALRPLVKRRAKHEPLQYITGHTSFMNARLRVTPDVLIPRIETEQLVEILLDDYPDETPLSVLDIGTGSGCIPIALKMERPAWELSAFDISAEALALARENASDNDVSIRFFQDDVTNPEQHPRDIDIIVSNPPYILPEEKDTLEPQVVDHEPSLALFCQSIDSMYAEVIRYAASSLTTKGTLYLEIHERYAEQILALFDPSVWSPALLKDYSKKQRFIKADFQA